MTAAVAGEKYFKAKHAHKAADKAAHSTGAVPADRAGGAKHAAVREGGAHRTADADVINDTSKTVDGITDSSSGKNNFSFTAPRNIGKYRQILVAEIVVGSFVILLEPSATGSNTDFSEAVEQLAAFLLVFFILALMTSAGPSAARISAALGFVILLTLMLRPKNVTIFSKIIPPGFSSKKATSSTPAGISPGLSAFTPVNPASLTLPSTAIQSNPVGQGGIYSA